MLNEKNIAYLDKLKEQAIALQTLFASKKRLEFEAGQLTDAELYKAYQNNLQDIIKQIDKLEIWFAERGDKV